VRQETQENAFIHVASDIRVSNVELAKPHDLKKSVARISISVMEAAGTEHSVSKWGYSGSLTVERRLRCLQKSTDDRPAKESLLGLY
jgi:hypothetical protein